MGRKSQLKRVSGKTRQSFAVEHLNRRLHVEVPPIVASYPDNNDEAEYPMDGRLKVVPQREFTPNVPFEMSEGKFTYDDMPNPVNQLGPILAGAEPVVTNNDFDSFMAAFNKRSNFVQAADDDIDDDVFDEALSIIREVPSLDVPEWDENEDDTERWLAKFDTNKRKRMEDATDAIPDASYKHLGTKDLSVKQECLLKRYDPKWAPRIIYAGNDVFNRVTGPACMVVMERLVSLLSRCTVGEVKIKLAYKTNDVSLVEFLDCEFEHCCEGDFSANDREQRSRVAVLYDAWLEKLRMPQWFRTLLMELETYTVRNLRFGIMALLKFQLPTGTTSTTPRNSCYNFTMFAVVIRRQHISAARAVVLGDDILAVCRKPVDIAKWVGIVAKFKMVLKGKAVRLIGEATLLSRRIIIAGDVKCMVPLLGKALARFNARATVNGAVSDSQYMAGKALSYAYEFRHVPYLRDLFLQRFKREDCDAVTLDDLTWFARTSGISLDNIMKVIEQESVLVSDDQFLEWVMDVYDIGLCEIDELFEQVILGQAPLVIEHYAVNNLAIDW